MPSPLVQVSDSRTDSGAEPAGARFAAVIGQYQTPLLRYVCRLLNRGPTDVEDIVQEALLRLHRKWQTDGRESVEDIAAWLYRVAHNLAMDQRRKRQRRSAAGEKLTDRYRQRREEQQAGPTDAVEQVMQREAVEFARRILEQLPEDQRAIVMLKIHQDLTLRQIAEVMHMSLSNVNYRMNQALRTMAGQMKKAGVI